MRSPRGCRWDRRGRAPSARPRASSLAGAQRRFRSPSLLASRRLWKGAREPSKRREPPRGRHGCLVTDLRSVPRPVLDGARRSGGAPCTCGVPCVRPDIFHRQPSSQPTRGFKPMAVTLAYGRDRLMSVYFRIGVGVGMLASAALGGLTVEELHAQAKPPVYFVGEIDARSDER